MSRGNQIRINPHLNQEVALRYSPFQFDGVSTAQLVQQPFIPLQKRVIESIKAINDSLTVSFYQHIDRHIGDASTYTLKPALIEALTIIYRRLDGEFDAQLGALSPDEKIAFFSKLTEGIEHCTAGFHDRVVEAVQSLSQPQSFSQLLNLVREDLVDRIAATLTDEVHARNTVRTLANAIGLGVRVRNRDDQYYGNLTQEKIINALSKQFQWYFTPFNIPHLVCDFLRSQLADVYTGPVDPTLNVNLPAAAIDIAAPVAGGGASAENSRDTPSNIFTSKTLQRVTEVFDQFLFDSAGQRVNELSFYFLKKDPSDEDCYVYVDIDWVNVERLIFNKLMNEKYFSTPLPSTLLDLIYIERDKSEMVPVAITILMEKNANFDYSETFWRGFFERASEALCAMLMTHSPMQSALSEALPLEKWPSVVKKTMPASVLSVAFKRMHRDFVPSFILLTDSNLADKDLFSRILEYGLRNLNALDASFFAILSCLINRMPDADFVCFYLCALHADGCSSVLTSLLLEGFRYDGDQMIQQCRQFLVELIEKVVTQDNVRLLIKGLCYPMQKGDGKGSTGCYWWMGAASSMVSKNLEIALRMLDGFWALRDKTANHQDVSTLIAGLCSRVEEGVNKGKTGCYLLMRLINSSFLKNPEIALRMLDGFLVLLDKTTNPQDVSTLIAGLCSRVEEGVHKGSTGCHSWMFHINNVASKNPEVALRMFDGFLALLNKTANPQDVSTFIAGFCSQVESDNYKGVTGCHLLMSAIHNVASKNPEVALRMLDGFFLALPNKINDPRNVATFVAGLCSRVEEGVNKGKTGCYHWMGVINKAALKNPEIGLGMLDQFLIFFNEIKKSCDIKTLAVSVFEGLVQLENKQPRVCASLCQTVLMELLPNISNEPERARVRLFLQQEQGGVQYSAFLNIAAKLPSYLVPHHTLWNMVEHFKHHAAKEYLQAYLRKNPVERGDPETRSLLADLNRILFLEQRTALRY